MLIKSPAPSEILTLIDVAIETFRPFYEDYVHPLMGDEMFQHQHGDWRGDYRRTIPTLDAPNEDRHTAVAEIDGVIAGFISWKVGIKPSHGEIYLLAVLPLYRRLNVGRQLCLHAIDAMKSVGVDVVEIGTGGDAFHAPARALYASLDFTMIPVVAYLKRI
jgi:ribosomal protein S18 acetylase RimI-like enzyme